jgi:OOP family OmpA-OmpF porin
MMRHWIIWRAAMPALLLTVAHVAAQAPQPATPRPGQVLATGAVPDEASKAAMLAHLRALYGAERVVDQISIAAVSLPPNWNGYLQKLIGPNLKLISKGELKVDGTNITLRGEVANEAQRQQIASDIATSLNPSYTVNNGLRVSAAEQNLLDATLAKRIIEFDSGKATLTPSGQGILDEMAAALQKVKNKKVEVIGHTDNVGLREPGARGSGAIVFVGQGRQPGDDHRVRPGTGSSRGREQQRGGPCTQPPHRVPHRGVR